MKIVTDSGMDTAPGQLDGFDVVQVPLKLELDGKTYLSGVDIQPEEFYELLLTTPSLPITSLPSPGEFAEVCTLAAAGHELLLVLGFLIVDQRLGRILLDLLGVAHDKKDADDRADDQEDQPPDQPLADGRPGETRGDAGGKGVDRRADDTDPRPE